MKSSFVKIKKQITIGEIVDKNISNIFWIIIFIINIIANTSLFYILDYYLENIIISNHHNIQFENTYKFIDLIENKLKFSNYVLIILSLLNIISIALSTFSKIDLIYIIANKIFYFLNNEIYFQFISYFSIILYKPIIMVLFVWNENINLKNEQVMIFSSIYYVLFESILFSFVIISLFGYLLSYVAEFANWILNYYNTNIKNIQIDSIEERYIKIDKVI